MAGRGLGEFSHIFFRQKRQHFDAVAISFLLAQIAAIAAPRVAGAVMLDHDSPRVTPVWAHEDASCVSGGDAGGNASFFYNYRPPSENGGLFSDIVSEKRAAQIRQDYLLQQGDYEARRNAGLTIPSGNVVEDLESFHNDQMKGISQNVMNEVQSHEGNKAADAADQVVSHNDGLQTAEKHAQVVGVIYGLYYDKPFTWQLEDAMTLVGHTNLRAQTGTLSLTSPILTSTLNIDNHASDPWSPTPVVPDPTVGAEQYRLSVSKPIPALDVTSSLAYGSTTNSAIASLSHPIVDHLICVVDSVYPMDDMGGSRPAEQRLKFFYHLDF